MVRELLRKMNDKQLKPHVDTLLNASSILFQQKNDKDKIYSFDEPHIWCIYKGKANNHMNYEPWSRSTGPMAMKSSSKKSHCMEIPLTCMLLNRPQENESNYWKATQKPNFRMRLSLKDKLQQHPVSAA